MNPKMLELDYDNLVMVIGRLENTYFELKEARELREQLIRELNGQDEEGDQEELQRDPIPDQERKNLETYQQLCLFIERMAERDTPAKTPQRSVQLFCAQYLYRQLVLHDPWFFEKPFLYILMGAALSDRRDYRTFIGPNIYDEVFEEASYRVSQKPQSGFFIRKNCLCPHHLCRLFSFFCFFKRSEDEVKDYADYVQFTERTIGRRLYKPYDERKLLDCANFELEVAQPFAKPSYRKKAHRYKKKDRPAVPEWTEVVPLIMNSLTRTHLNMNWSRTQLCKCTCMNFMVALILAVDFIFLVSILYLYDLGWRDASQPFSALAFFSTVNNSNKSEGDSFTVLLIIAQVGALLYLLLMTCLLKKAWRGLLGIDLLNHQIVGPCSCHNCIYLFGLIFSSWLFFSFMATYIYVFSCDVEQNNHHRFREIKCYDGGLHLTYVITTLCALPIYYPIASITWPMVQTVNLSDRVKISPFFILFFNHCKILIIATSAFLKHEFMKLFVRSIAILVILLILLFIVFFLLPCKLLGFNWLLATLVVVAAWLAFCIILLVDGTAEYTVATLMALGAVALLLLFLLILMIYCCIVKRRIYEPQPPPKPVYKASIPPPPPEIEEEFQEQPPPKIELQPFKRRLAHEQVNLRDPQIPDLHYEMQKEKVNQRLTHLLPMGTLRNRKEREIQDAKEAQIRDAIRRREETERQLAASRRMYEEYSEQEDQYSRSQESEQRGRRYQERESPLRNEEDLMRRFRPPELIREEPKRSYEDINQQKEGSGYELQIQYGESGSQITVTEGGTELSFEEESRRESRRERRVEKRMTEEEERDEESFRQAYRGRPVIETRYEESEEEPKYQEKRIDRYSRGYYSQERTEEEEQKEDLRVGFTRQDQVPLDYDEVDVDMVPESREGRERRLNLDQIEDNEEDERSGALRESGQEEWDREWENEQDWSSDRDYENEKDQDLQGDIEGGEQAIAKAKEAMRNLRREETGGSATPTGWSQFRRKEHYER